MSDTRVRWTIEAAVVGANECFRFLCESSASAAKTAQSAANILNRTVALIGPRNKTGVECVRVLYTPDGLATTDATGAADVTAD